MAKERWICLPAEFTPTEVEKITGLSADLQRVWRHRGYLSRRRGTGAKFHVLEVAALMVRQRLMTLGFPPGESQEVGDRCAPIVVFHSLFDVPICCEVFGTETEIDQFREEFFADDRELICKIVGINPDRSYRRCLLGMESSPPELCASLEDVMDDPRTEFGYFLSLEGLGRNLAHNARRPLATIEFTTAKARAGAKPERRIREVMTGPPR